MSAAELEYAPLPGKGKTLAGIYFSGEHQRLYACDDHVLAVRINRGEETYKKFYYNDIQAISLKTNSERGIRAALQGAVIVLVALGGMLINLTAEPELNWIYWIVLVLIAYPAVMLILNLVKGPTCTVTLHTAVQAEELTALRRLSEALETIRYIDENIRAGQGDLDIDALRQRSAEGQTVQASGHLPRKAKRVAIRDIDGIPHAIAFASLFYGGVSTFADFVIMVDVKNFADSAVAVIGLLFLLIAAFQQTSSTMSPRLKLMTWLGIGNYAILYVVGIVIGFMIGINGDYGSYPGIHNPSGQPASQWPLLHQTAYGLGGVFSLAIAVGGFTLLRRYRERDAASSQLDSEFMKADDDEFA